MAMGRAAYVKALQEKALEAKAASEAAEQPEEETDVVQAGFVATPKIHDVMKNPEIEEFVLLGDAETSEKVRNYVIEKVSGAPNTIDLVKLAYLHVQGYSNEYCAVKFNTTIKNIGTAKGDPRFKDILHALNAEIVKTARLFLTISGMKAVMTLVSCLNSADDRTRMKASTEILDRIGVKSPEQIELIQNNDKIKNMNDADLLGLIKMGTEDLEKQLEES